MPSSRVGCRDYSVDLKNRATNGINVIIYRLVTSKSNKIKTKSFQAHNPKSGITPIHIVTRFIINQTHVGSIYVQYALVNGLTIIIGAKVTNEL